MVVVVDTSALVAILFDEPEAQRFADAIGAAPARLLSAVTRVEPIAIDAFRRFGRGRHRAALNIGDCFSYALAAATRPVSSGKSRIAQARCGLRYVGLC